MGGSPSKTSMPAPAILPEFKASARAALSTTGPREVLIRMALGFILARRSPLIRPLVPSFNGVWRDTMSHSASRVSRST